MVQAMTKHVMEKHPETAKAMEKMHNDDPKKMGERNEAEVGGDARDITPAGQ